MGALPKSVNSKGQAVKKSGLCRLFNVVQIKAMKLSQDSRCWFGGWIWKLLPCHLSCGVLDRKGDGLFKVIPGLWTGLRLLLGKRPLMVQLPNEVRTQPFLLWVTKNVDTGRSGAAFWVGLVHKSQELTLGWPSRASKWCCRKPASQTYAFVSSSPGTKTVSDVPSVGRVWNRRLWLRKKVKSIVKVKLMSVIAIHMNIPPLVNEMSPALKRKNKVVLWKWGKGGIVSLAIWKQKI